VTVAAPSLGKRDTLVNMEIPGSAPVDAAVAAPAGLADAAGLAAADGERPAATGPVWLFLLSPRWLAWLAFVIVAFWGMLWLGDWQFHRAISGNGLSWAYTFEWPLFAGFGVVFWARTVRDELRLRRGPSQKEMERAAAEAAAGPVLPDGIGTRQIDRPADDADDADLASYNAYLDRLNSEVKGHGRWRGYG
jgi:DNA-binding transcriptional regulator of glucitol operon